MKRKSIISILIMSLVLGTLLFSVENADAVTVPSDYLSTLDDTVRYKVININETGANEWWSMAFSKRGNWESEIGSIWNFTITDFEDDDGGYLVDNPIPYFDVNITELDGSQNFTLANISNSEIAMNLGLGYLNFQHGLVVRKDNWDQLATDALSQRKVERWWAPGTYDNASVVVTNTTGFVTYQFKQETGLKQNTTLTYSKDTGRLVYAKTKSSEYYWLEIQLISGFEREIAELVQYKVTDCNETGVNEWWNLAWVKRGDWKTSVNSIWNFTLSDLEDDNGGYDVENPIPYFDMLIADNGVANFTESNISNSEIAVALSLGYMNFQPGLSVRIDRWDALAQKALEQSQVERSWAPGTYDYADVTITNTSTNVTYEFAQSTGMMQNTTLTYSKTTGRLIYAKTQSSQYYWLEIELYEDSGSNGPNPGIPGYISIYIGVSALVGIFIILQKKRLNIRR